MIKFFRKTRYDLMEQNKTGKYLKYAISEIVLVVIGILIALSINNWNDRRQLKVKELNYYGNLKSQFENDKLNIKSIIEYNTHYLERFQIANQIISENKLELVDSLSAIVQELMYYSDFDKQGNIYETLVNSGEIQNISNQAIVNLLQNLEDSYLYINRMENIHFDLINQHVLTDLIEVVNFETLQATDIDKLYSTKFQNLIIISLEVMK